MIGCCGEGLAKAKTRILCIRQKASTASAKVHCVRVASDKRKDLQASGEDRHGENHEKQTRR